MGLVLVKLGNLSSYKTLNTLLFFAYLLLLLKFWATSPIVISTCFKMLLLGVLKGYKLRIFYRLVELSIRFSSLLGFLNACSKVYIHFVLWFYFKMQIYCRLIVINHEDLLDYVGTLQLRPMGITWLKYTQVNLF